MANINLNNVASKATADAHYANNSNPHSVTKSQVGLGDVDNTSDANKPVSSAQQAALDLKQSISTLATNVLSIVLTGFVAGANTAIAATDTLAQALAKIQGQINARPNENATTIATINHAAAEKSSLVDADEITGQDSAASFSLIRTTWTNVKAFLKTYFDTIYTSRKVNAKISRTTTQSITLNTDTVVQCGTVDYDPDSITDIANYRIVIPRAGRYRIFVRATATGQSNGSRVFAQVGINGTVHILNTCPATTGSTQAVRVEGFDDFTLAENDLITLVQQQGNTANTLTDSPPFLIVQEL